MFLQSSYHDCCERHTKLYPGYITIFSKYRQKAVKIVQTHSTCSVLRQDSREQCFYGWLVNIYEWGHLIQITLYKTWKVKYSWTFPNTFQLSFLFLFVSTSIIQPTKQDVIKNCVARFHSDTFIFVYHVLCLILLFVSSCYYF